MEEIFKEVLVKKCGNRRHDQVMVIENLPRKFLFEQTRKMIQRIDRDGYPDGTMVVDPSGALIWTLYQGIEKSQTGDGGYLFWVGDQESENRLKDIMRYVDMSFPRDQRIPEFVDNAQMRGESNTGPIPYNMIPRLTLPIPETPKAPEPPPLRPAPVPEIPVPSQVSPQAPAGRIRSEEKLAAMRARMQKARDARKAKEVVPALQ